MNRSTIEMIMDINSDNTLNIARMLISINTFSNRNKTSGIIGINKLAIYLFLIKYPQALCRMIEIERSAGKKNSHKLKIVLQNYELQSIESQMMPLNFAPWDCKYRNDVAILTSKNLVKVATGKNKIDIFITDTGEKTVNSLTETNFYKEVENKSKVIKSVFGQYATSTLINKIYIALPEILEAKIELDVTYED